MTSVVPLGSLISCPAHAIRVFAGLWRRSVLLSFLLGLLVATAVTLLLLLLASLLKLPSFSFPSSGPPPRSPRIYRIYPQAKGHARIPPANTSTDLASSHHNSTYPISVLERSSCTSPHGSSAAMQATSLVACTTNTTQAGSAAQQAEAAPQQQPWQQPVPFHLWQTFRTAPLPRRAQTAVDSWRRLNPTLTPHLHTDQDGERFVASAFANETLAMYRSFPLGVMRADFWRYAILRASGGIYADVDVRCKRAVHDWLPPRDDGAAGLPLGQLYNSLSWANCSVVIGLENDVHWCQWAFAATAGHPLLTAVLDTIVKRARSGIDTSNEHFVHLHTGPGTWTDAIGTFFKFPLGSSARVMFNAVYSDPVVYRLVVQQYRVCFTGFDFFNFLNVENLYGSTMFPDGQDGWVSWTRERARLVPSQLSPAQGVGRMLQGAVKVWTV